MDHIWGAGEYSDGDIARRLNRYQRWLDDGTLVRFRSKGQPGWSNPGPFGKESVRSLLQRPFYTGVVAYYGVAEDGQKHQLARCR